MGTVDLLVRRFLEDIEIFFVGQRLNIKSPGSGAPMNRGSNVRQPNPDPVQRNLQG
jgi:hypothetical protein